MAFLNLLNIELKKFFSYKLVFLIPLIYVLLISFSLLLLSNALKIDFLDSYFRWLNISNDKDIFQFLIGKTRLINAILIGLVIVFSGFWIFAMDYKLSLINIISNSKISYLTMLITKILILLFYLLLHFMLYLLAVYFIRILIIYENPLVIRFDPSNDYSDYVIYISFFIILSFRNALLLGVLSRFLNFNKVYFVILLGLYIYFSFSQNSPFVNTFFNQKNIIQAFLIQLVYCSILIISLPLIYLKSKLWNG